MAKIIDPETAALLIRDGDSVMFGGSGSGHGVADAVIEAIVSRFKIAGSPGNLTLSSVVTVGDWEDRGFSRFALPGLAKTGHHGRIQTVRGCRIWHWRMGIQAYTLPQGALCS